MILRPDTIAAAAARLRSLEEDTAPSVTKAERRAVFLLAAAGRLQAPKKASLGTAHDHAAQRARADETAEEAFYAAEKAKAYQRAEVEIPGGVVARCEFVSLGKRCADIGLTDPDHVLGGSTRRECEALGAEGLQVLCRTHHDLKHANSPTRRFWIDQAYEHAIRINARRLVRLVERARALNEAKHAPRRDR